MDLSQYSRRKAHDVRIGGVTIGSAHPVEVQSMTNTPTADTEASVAQCERIADAGARIVRLTAQGRREGENLENIVRRLREDGYTTAVVADIHFVPEVAAIAARYVDKVRINPGNYCTSHGELEALIAQCRERGVALRIGVNHGSLARRVFDEWGDTPQGMVVSAMEFLRVCRREGFDQVVVSMKSSNTRVMVHAYRLLVEAMDREVRKQISTADLEDFIRYDGEAQLHELTPEFFRYLAMLSPFGHSNVKPIYRFNEVQVVRCSTVGGSHTRGIVRSRTGQSDFIAFNRHCSQFHGKTLDILATPQMNVHQGVETPQLNIIDIRDVY